MQPSIPHKSPHATLNSVSITIILALSSVSATHSSTFSLISSSFLILIVLPFSRMHAPMYTTCMVIKTGLMYNNGYIYYHSHTSEGKQQVYNSCPVVRVCIPYLQFTGHTHACAQHMHIPGNTTIPCTPVWALNYMYTLQFVYITALFTSQTNYTYTPQFCLHHSFVYFVVFTSQTLQTCAYLSGPHNYYL